MKKIIMKFGSLINRSIYKKKNKVCLSSFPDYSDNCLSVFNYILRDNKKNLEIVWLVSDFNIPENIKNSQRTHNVKVIKKNSIRGILNYMTSKYVFYTHGLYNGMECLSKQTIVNLWHGMPLKRIGLLDNKGYKDIPKFSYTLATSTLFQEIIAKVFGVSEEKVIISGLPRNDEMMSNKHVLEKLNITKESYNKVILWMPTYRKSVVGDIRSDGNNNNSLPLLSNEKMTEFNDFLIKNNNLCIIKLHPMDKLNIANFEKMSNIVFINNQNLKNINESLNSIYAEVDALLTDYSSVYFDFMLLNKPIAFIIEDIEKYSHTRGFVFEDIEEWLPGPRILQISELKDFISDINNNSDVYYQQRQKVNQYVNKYNDNHSTKRLLRFLNLIEETTK